MEEYFYLWKHVILFGALFIAGLRAISDDDKILFPLRKLAKTWPPIIGKPFILCSFCMASIWGTVIYFTLTFLHFDVEMSPMGYTVVFIGWPICVLSISIVAGFAWGVIEIFKHYLKK